MPRRRVSFEFEVAELRDLLARTGPAGAVGLGESLVATILAEPGAADVVRMDLYGVLLLESIQTGPDAT